MNGWTLEAVQRNIAGEGGATIANMDEIEQTSNVTIPTDKPPLEHDEQARLAAWAWGQGLLLYANANQYREGQRPEAGMVAGVPDLFLAEQRGGYGGMYIEMKRDGRQNEKRGGKLTGGLSDEQADIIIRLREAGYYVAICYGYEEGRQAIEKYRRG